MAPINDRLPWFRCFPSALLGALGGMPPDEGYTYVAILLRIYETAGPVMETAATLSRRTGLSSRRAAMAIEALIANGKILMLSDGRLDSQTTHVEISYQNESRRKNSLAGKLGADRRAEKAQRNQQNGSTHVQRSLSYLDIEEEREESSNIENNLTQASSPKKGELAHVCFDEFWKGYPTDTNMSKLTTERIWSRMTEEHRRAAVNSLPAFRAYCASKPDYRPVYADKYLKEARYVGFNEVAAKAAGKVFVAKDTPEWEAWQRVKKTHAVMSSEHRREGWWFESAWPHEPARGAA